MHDKKRARLIPYGVAVLAVAVSLLLRAHILQPVMGVKSLYLTFCPAVMIAAYFGGFRPGLLATILGAVTADFLFVDPLYDLWIHTPEDLLSMLFFVLVGTFLSGVCEALHRSRRRVAANERRYAVTLSSIGDAVIATDTQARVTFLNPVAEVLTGWSLVDASGQPLAEVFRIVNEQTRQLVEDPAVKVLRLGTVVGLANHTVLLARDGREVPIDDSGAPIVDEGGGIAGVVLVFRDISERKRAEDALRENEERFRCLVQNSSDIISLFDAEGTVLYQAPSVERLLGYRPHDRIGHNIYRDPIVHPEDMAAKRAFFDALLRQPGAPVTAEFRLRHADGSLRDIEAVGQNFLHDPGVAGIVANYRDVTERKRAEEALRESEHRWRSITEALPQLVWTARPDGYVDYQSTQFGEYFGLPEDKMLGWQWLELLHPDDRERARLAWQAAIEQDGDYDLEVRLRGFDGVYHWFKTRGVRVRDDEGRVFKWFGTCTDITDGKQTEEALRESEQRWRNLAEALPQLVWTAAPDGACDYFSMQWTQHTGVPEDRLLGWQWMETLHPDDREPTRRFWLDSVAGRSPYDVEYRVRRTDGEYCWFKTRGVPIRDSAGRIVKWFGTCTDITDSRTAAEELRLAKEAAESANRAKDEFLANVSHEIRTPMNAILGMTELVLDTSLTEDQQQSLKTVKAAADSLLGIINDLLDFSKIEAGKLVLAPAEFSLRGALGDTLRTLAMRAHRKGLELVSHVPPEVPDSLVGDAGRLRQVLLNLIGNAIKFAKHGEVELRVETVRNDANDDVELRFAVSDTGIGIPQEKQDTIFRAFEQEDTSTTRRYGGTGLGLTIAAQLVALMSGTITVESEPGRGSTFAFRARFGRGLQPAKPPSAQPPILIRNLRVLIVDDNDTNRRILVEWLRGWQMDAAAVSDGPTALDSLWDAVTDGRPYELVLLDARMPDTDGLSLAASIRKRAELSATRIILLTSGNRPGDIERLRELRIDAHLLKPLQQSELLDTIYNVMSHSNGGSAATEMPLQAQRPAADPSFIPLHILVAEDNEFSAQLLEQLLTRRGHRVTLATNGTDAVARTRDDDFDLLFLDIHMPELDGFQVVQAIREREHGGSRRLPVIALTARSRKEDRDKCLAAGMDDFLVKPVHTDSLWQAIDRVMADCDRTDHPNTQLLDAPVLLAACGGDDVILEKICQAFVACLPDQLHATQAAFRDSNAHALREAAHKLSSTLAAFSTIAGNAVSSLEDQAAAGQVDACGPLVSQLATMSESLVRQINGLSIDWLRSQVAKS
jgi:two-component system sensor histidine kinase/response regulator